MNVAGRIALAAGGAAIGGGAAYAMNRHGAANDASARAQIAQRSEQARQEWAGFEAALEAEFPNLRLETSEDHARLDRFLQQHPAPSWIKLEHEGYTRIHLSTDGFLPGGLQRAGSGEHQFVFGMSAAMAVGGPALAIATIARPGLPGFGAAAAATLGGLMIGPGVAGMAAAARLSNFNSTAYALSDSIVQDVNSHR